MMAVFAVVAAACGGGGETTTTSGATTTTAAGATTTTAAGETTTTAASGSFGTYSIAAISDIVTDNYWTYLGDGSAGTVYTAYVNASTARSMFSIDLPTLQLVPDLADSEPAEPVETADGWTITQTMRQDVEWSDGEPITANDVVFTYETVRDLAMGGDWISSYPYADTMNPQLLAVTAIDDYTVEYTFNARPGLGTWPHITGVSGAVLPAHFWGDKVEAAKASADPATTLFGESGIGGPSGGAAIIDTWEPGAFIRKTANENFSDRGQRVVAYASGGVSIDGVSYGDTSGEVLADYTVGPFFTDQVFSIYTDQNLAVTALIEGEVDYWINPLGIGTGLRQQVLSAPNLTTVANPTNGMRYMAFNLTKSPMNNKAFRQALAFMVDKEFLTQSVLQGVAFPMYTMVPEGNVKWHDRDFSAAQKEKYQIGTEARLNAAIALLKEAGFTWSGNEPTFDANTVRPGSGLVDPDGVPVPELEVLTPGQAYDPLRSTAALWIETWLEQLGAPARTNPTDFNTLVDAVYTLPATFDMYLLGWSLGNPAYPSFHESFWHSRNSLDLEPNGNNAPQYKSDAFDVAADAIINATTEEEAYAAMWEAEAILAEDLPYIVLFDTPITESFNTELRFPFTNTLSGLQFGQGFASLVSK
jgi:peptide/nickel transport system substrate-binding protein